MTPAQRNDLLRLHDLAVKATQRWESATPGTRARRLAELRAERAEAQFAAALDALTDCNRQ